MPITVNNLKASDPAQASKYKTLESEQLVRNIGTQHDN
jgi:hypothetical protein